jgi:hypothetical protein
MAFRGRALSCNREIADAFNEHFISVYNIGNSECGIIEERELNDIDVTLDETIAALSNASLGTGPDSIPGVILRRFATELAPHFQQLFRAIIETGNYPSNWKMAKVVPVFKSGNKEDVANYRPISILSKASLVLERIIFQHLFRFIRSKLSDRQYGFLNRRSTVSQLLEYVYLLYENHDRNSTSYCLYLDFSKAFDKVPHDILISKFQRFGIGGKLLRLLRSYLSNRSQYVETNGAKSDTKPITSGVPQGSILAIIMFLSFIDDISEVCELSLPFFFADDGKVIADFLRALICDSDNLLAWATLNRMTFNVTKTILFTCPKTAEALEFDGTPITPSSQVKDLGIIISANLNWEAHIRKRISLSSHSLLQLQRNIPNSTSRQTKLRIYKAYVLTALLYASSVWYPNSKQLALLESVQHRATRWICRGTQSYTARLAELKLLPISLQLQLTDLLMFNKLLNGLYDLDIWKYISLDFRHSHNLRRSALPLFTSKKCFRLKKTEQCYFSRIVYLANRLHKCSSISLFDPPVSVKKKLLEMFLNYLCDEYSEATLCTKYLFCYCSQCKCLNL